MYPNYTKAFLNLEGVSIKKVVQADSFIKIFIQSQPVEQTCPCCGAKTKRIHDYRLQEVQDIPLLGKQVILLLRKRRYLCPYCRKRFTEPYSFLPSYHRRTRRLAFYIVSLLRQTFSLKQIAELPVFPSRRSAAFWTRFAILRLTSFHKRFPLTNSKAMLLPVNISAFWLIRKSVGSSTFSRIGPKAIWLIIGGTFPGKNA